MKKIFIIQFAFFFAFLLSAYVYAETEKTFQVKKGGNLEISVVGDVTIRTTTKDEVYIKVKGLSGGSDDDLKMTCDGNTVSVIYDSHRSHHTPSFEIQIPEQFNANMKTAGGDIDIKGFLKGEVNGKTAGGDISTQKIEGNVSMKTAGGSIRCGDIIGEVKLTTAGGDISAGNIRENASLTTAGGDIEVKNVGKALIVKNTGGNIKVGTVGGEFKASTLGGNIEGVKAESSAKLTTSGGDIDLEGGEGFIEAITSGGDIKLSKIRGALKAVTSGGEVTAELYPDGKTESKLASAGGKILLYIAESAGVTIEAEIKLHGDADNSPYKIISDFKADKYSVDDDNNKIKGIYLINGGGKLIKISTAESDIELKRISK